MTSPSATELHVTVRGRGKPLLLIHGSMTGDPELDDWQEQAALADHYELRMVARRGYFISPDRLPSYGFEAESDELAALLGDGMHVIGFSYGGFLALLMAAKRPDAVRSLTLIEPAALSIGRGNSDVEGLIARIAPLHAAAPRMSAEQYLLAFRRALRGLPADTALELTEQDRHDLADPIMRRGIETARLEQPQWEATIPLDALAAASFPKLVVSGGWSPAFETICDTLDQRLPAERAVIRGAGHPVQMIGELFNERLLAFLRATPQ
ncbi:MAG TPA: alpha/beta hydrolase [Ktedonobacterales bacterium]|nr:alpha/beta hydrolase [Ktedonobacterales bacterium]